MFMASMVSPVSSVSSAVAAPFPLTPKEIVAQLDQFIIGQTEAKRAVAVALRNRWRRMQLPLSLRDEIMPKNILMIGSTGIGKTEIARRVAQLVDAPFIKVEATKFTEVGYVGRDVDSIIRDLVDKAVKMIREKEMSKVRTMAEEVAEERVLNVLLPPLRGSFAGEPHEPPKEDSATRQLYRDKLRSGELDDKEIEIEVASAPFGLEIMAPPGMEEMTNQLQNMFHSLNTDRKKSRKLKIVDAKRLIRDEEAAKLINDDEIKTRAIVSVEQHGIVFIDEIDKIAKRGEFTGTDVSREGVQRDLLPLIEGCTISTKYGAVRTDHILFVASGAFHFSKPSDLIPELQGRLPIRVELKSLTTEDFVRILTEPRTALTAQYTALLSTEKVEIQFTVEGVRRIAEIAWSINERMENIGARRLHTVIERLLDDISYDADEMAGQMVQIDADYVDKRLQALVADEDLTSYIL